MLDLSFTASLETTTGFTLGTDKLNTGVLGYIETPLNASIRSVSWSRGRSSILDNFSAGSCRVVFDNRNRLFDPANTSSVLYGELRPGRSFTLLMTQGIQTVRVFSGFIESWEYDYTLDGDATVTANVLDAFSWLANKQITSVVAPEELSGARVTRILDAIGWPLSLRSIDVGYSTLAAETITNTSALEYLSEVAQSEFGMFFADASGIIKFRQRNRVNGFSDFYITNDSTVNDPYIQDIELDYSFDRIYNKVIITNNNLSLIASSSNTSSVSTYGERAKSFDTLISNTTQMQTIADGLVTLYGTPNFIVKSVGVNLQTLQLLVTGAIQTNNIVDWSTLDIGYLTGVYWLPPGTVNKVDPISITALMITGIRFDASPSGAKMAVDLDYAFGYGSFILDDGLLGKLDSGKLGV